MHEHELRGLGWPGRFTFGTQASAAGLLHTVRDYDYRLIGHLTS